MTSKKSAKTTKHSASKTTSPQSASSSKPQPNIVTIEPCDKCPKADFKSTAERGRHMLHAHGIPGSSPTALLRRKAKSGEIGSRPTQVETYQPSVRPGPQGRGLVPPFIVGELLGQFREIIRFKAEQQGVSKNDLIDEVCEGLQKDVQGGVPVVQAPSRPVTQR